MGELIFLSIIGGIVFAPLVFLVWTISSISRLKKQAQYQETELEAMQERVTRLQSALRRLETTDRAPAAAHPPGHADVSQPYRPAREEIVRSDVSGMPTVATPSQTAVAGHLPSAAAYPPSSDLAASAGLVSAPDADAGDRETAEPLEIQEGVMPENSQQVNAFFDRMGQHPSGDTPARPAAQPRSSRESAAFRPERPAASPATDWNSMDFESMIGGNLMNKAGAFLLVIGLALFLNYSFASLGPWAKLASGAVFSVLLLAWGVFLEHRNGGNLMSIGLIGGGWSCLYLTAFAAHGVTATKVIESPVAGMSLLILVAAGMIVHSLRYRSEMATGLAFIFAFASLFVAEVSLFSEVAAVIMAIGMLGISWYFEWHQLAASGLVLTYGSMLARLHWNAPPSTLGPIERVMFIQSLLFVLWTTYEIVGMSFMRRNPASEEVTRFLFPMNFIAYLVASLLTWPKVVETPVYYLAGMIMAQYILTGLARGVWCSNPGEAAVEKARFFMGSCEDSLVIAAGALCYGIWYLLPAPVVVIGWAVTGLMLIEVAYRLPWQLMRFIGHLIVTIAFFRVFIANLDIAGTSGGISHRLLTVVPVIFLMLHLYFRTDTELSWEASPTGGTRQFAPAYSYFAVVLAGVLFRFEFGPGLTPPALAVAAVIMSGLGQKLKNWHFRRQGLYLALIAIGYGLANDWRCDSINPVLASPWTIGIITVTCLYACRWLAGRDDMPEPDSLLAGMDSIRPHAFSLAGSVGLAFLLYVQISGGFLTLAWSLLGMGLLAAGFVCKDRLLRFSGLGLVLLCIVKVFLYDARELEAPLRILAFMALGATMIAISWAYTRYKDKIEELLK